MITIDTRGLAINDSLIPIIKTICSTPPGEWIEAITNDPDAFQNIKKYLAEQGIGFREIYDGEQMKVQFTLASL